MNRNSISRRPQQEAQTRGRALLQAMQTRGLANLQLQLQQQDKSLPAIVSNDSVWAIRRSLQERIGVKLQELMDAVKAMAENAAPWMKEFYKEVLRKYILTRENLQLLGRVASISWKGAKALLGWVLSMWKRSPGIVGLLGGAAFGIKVVAGVSGFLSSIPLFGSFLAGAAAVIAIGGSAYIGARLGDWLHSQWYRNRQFDQNAEIKDRLVDLEQLIHNQILHEAK